MPDDTQKLVLTSITTVLELRDAGLTEVQHGSTQTNEILAAIDQVEESIQASIDVSGGRNLQKLNDAYRSLLYLLTAGRK